MKTTIPLDSGLKEELAAAKFGSEEIQQVEEFLVACNFCHTARIYLVRLLSRARRAKKLLAAMALLGRTYEILWKHNPPDRIGDSDDVTIITEAEPGKMPQTWGWHNTCAFFQIYKDLGIRVKGLY